LLCRKSFNLPSFVTPREVSNFASGYLREVSIPSVLATPERNSPG
jgi:hypothetical protein